MSKTDTDTERDLNAAELLTRATSLLDLTDALTDAIELNYHEASRLRDALVEARAEVNPRPALRAHGRVSALVDHAVTLLQAQERELETLSLEVAAARPDGAGT